MKLIYSIVLVHLFSLKFSILKVFIYILVAMESAQEKFFVVFRKGLSFSVYARFP